MLKTKKAKTETRQDKAIAFRAPSEIHGALKHITGILEMHNFQVDGRIPFERDILSWLVADLYKEGPEHWAERLAGASKKFNELVTKNN